MSAGESAANNPGQLDQVFKKAEYLIENRVKTEVEMAHYISHKISTNDMVDKLDLYRRVHLTGTVLPRIQTAKTNGGNLTGVIKAIKEEEQLLADLHGELTYSKQELIEKAEQAHTNRQTKTVEHLEKAAHHMIKEGIKSEDEMVTMLKASVDIKKTVKELEVGIERYGIDQKLAKLKTEKAAAKTPEDVIKVIGQNQEYLASLHGNLQNQGHTELLLSAIKQAHLNSENHAMDKLNDVVVHIGIHNIMTPDKLITQLRNTNDAEALHKGLTNICQNHHLNEIKGNITKIFEDDSVKVRGTKFKCPVKYLEHEIAHQTHSYIDREHLVKTMLPNVQQKVKQMEMQYSR